MCSTSISRYILYILQQLREIRIVIVSRLVFTNYLVPSEKSKIQWRSSSRFLRKRAAIKSTLRIRAAEYQKEFSLRRVVAFSKYLGGACVSYTPPLSTTEMIMATGKKLGAKFSSLYEVFAVWPNPPRNSNFQLKMSEIALYNNFIGGINVTTGNLDSHRKVYWR